MNRKRIFTVFVAIAIAGMLIILPYETNAVDSFIAVMGFEVSLGLLSYIYDWLTDRHTSDNIQYDVNATVYINQWKAKFDGIENELATVENFANNEVEMLKQQNLFWVRYAERKAVEYLNYDTWTTDIEENITKDFDNYVYNLSLSIMNEYLNILHELVFEINQMAGYTFSSTSQGAQMRVWALSGDIFYIGKWYSSGWQNNKIGKAYILWGSNAVNTTELIYNITGGKVIKTLGNCSLIITNTTNISALLGSGIYITFNDLAKQFTIRCKGDTFFTPYWMFVAPSTNSYENDEKIEIIYNNGSVSKTVAWNYTGGFSWKVEMQNVYETIKNNMIVNAHAYWQYLKDKGYNDVSEVPEDEIPVYPDILLDNIDALGNLSFDDAMVLYYSILSQLNNTDLLNKTNLTDSDFIIANYTGKVANITLLKWTGLDTYTTLIDAHRCYILPFKNDLTISINGIYAITNLTTLPAWNITGYYGVSESNITKIKQMLAIYDIDGKQYLLLHPNADIIYTFKVLNLTEDGKAVNSLTYDVLDLGNFTMTTWGFRLSTITNPNDLIIPQSTTDWLDEYKGLIVISCIVLGVVFTVSSRKGSGVHTIGVLLLIAGLGMAAYWYILPAWESFTNTLSKLNPLNWF